MTLTIIAWAVLFMADTSKNEVTVIDLGSLNEPVRYGHAPLMVDNWLYVHDNFDEKVKAYTFSDDYQTLQFMWESPGSGLGPGEIPPGSRVNNFAISRTDNNLWVSHRTGFTIYDAKGHFFRNIKLPFNQSRILIDKTSMVVTSQESLRSHSLLTKLQPSKDEPVWETPSNHGIPVNKNGQFIEDLPEIFRLKNGYALYTLTLGHLYIIDPEGEVELFLELPFNGHETFQIDSYEDNFQFGKQTFTVARLPKGFNRSGMAQTNDKLWLTVQNWCRGIRTADGEFLAKKNTDNPSFVRVIYAIPINDPTNLRRYFTPHLNGIQYEILSMNEQFLWVFESENGEKLMRIPRTSLSRVESLVF